MALPALSRLYRRLGRFYPYAFLTIELQSAFVITAATLGLFGFYYNASTGDYLKVLGVGLFLTGVAVATTLVRTFPLIRPVADWIGGSRGAESTRTAWAAAVVLPLNLIRRDLWVPIVVTVVPTCAWAVIVLGLAWVHFIPFFVGSMVALGYSAILHYLILEAGMRPVLLDLNQSGEAPRRETVISAIPLRLRLMTALPLINLITGLVVAALTSPGGGSATLGVDVLAAVAVATAISLELTVLFAKSIVRPIADLQRATDAVREGRFDVSVPVTTGDELGELAASFNQMVEGLAERERLREAFGTYLDKSVAEYILSEGFSEEGEEVEVSVLFCDVRDFTSFAAQADAKEVVMRLNALFAVVVPIVNRHGGHVDKFVGDGLLAMFGAPEPFPNHADRAVRAACEMASVVNSEDERAWKASGARARDSHGHGRLGDPGIEPGFRIGVGVNTGRVVAGSIGGAGRLNFSVIGDAVNVAARVEAATREIGESVLITKATARELSEDIEVTECGEHELRGLPDAFKLYAPRMREADGVQPGEEPLAAARDDGRRGDLGEARRAGGLAPL